MTTTKKIIIGVCVAAVACIAVCLVVNYVKSHSTFNTGMTFVKASVVSSGDDEVVLSALTNYSSLEGDNSSIAKGTEIKVQNSDGYYDKDTLPDSNKKLGDLKEGEIVEIMSTDINSDYVVSAWNLKVVSSIKASVVSSSEDEAVLSALTNYSSLEGVHSLIDEGTEIKVQLPNESYDENDLPDNAKKLGDLKEGDIVEIQTSDIDSDYVVRDWRLEVVTDENYVSGTNSQVN